MLKNIGKLWRKTQCFLGLHEGEFKYLFSHSCLMESTCNHCSKISTKTIHESWDEYSYIEDNKCLQERLCRRCEEKENRTAHQWSGSQPDSSSNPHPCKQVRHCVRCMREEVDSYNHAWGEWVYESPKSGQLIRFCRKCDERQLGEVVQRNDLDSLG
jgi:hypothetical protein